MNQPNVKPGESTALALTPCRICLGDLVSALSSYFGTQKTRQSLIAGLPLVDGCIDEHQLTNVAERAGLTCRPLFVAIDQITDLELPALLLLKDQQACVGQEKGKRFNCVNRCRWHTANASSSIAGQRSGQSLLHSTQLGLSI